MEKTPKRVSAVAYANGDDRGGLLKQSRILTAEDRAQMETAVDLGDGKGPRYIEALPRSAKVEEEFQYEVVRLLVALTDSIVQKMEAHDTKIQTPKSAGNAAGTWLYEIGPGVDDTNHRERPRYRILEPKSSLAFVDDCGLDADIANHNQISGLSGGQKVKVVR